MKIAVIGAGSATFSMKLIRDLCLNESMKDNVVCLMDINETSLNDVYGLCARYADEIGTRLNLEKTTDRRTALAGASFVINTALATGGHKRLLDGWSIAMKHGYRFGGSYHIVHDEAFWINFYQIRLMESILKDIIEICPEAWYLVVANPVCAGITYLKRKYKKERIVGLCHGSGDVYRIVKTIGLEKEHVTFKVPGVNHFIWLTSFKYKGENAFPILDKWIELSAEKQWNENREGFYKLNPAEIDLYRRFGVFPIGDTCAAGGGAWPYWYHINDEYEKKWQESPYEWYKDAFVHMDARCEKINKLVDDYTRKVTEVFPPDSLYGEPMIPLIEAIYRDMPMVSIVNILNEGHLVPGVPEDFEVEVPALVDKSGIHGIKTDGLPKELVAYILRDRVAPVEMELAAFAKHSKQRLLQLILMDPWTRSEEQAKALLADILSLPFNKEMQQYYE
jgi:alpha-galactosidase